MIRPNTAWQADSVAQHYDELDALYREVWGEHLHHGLWLGGRETPERATVQLLERVAAWAQLKPAAQVCDVGCGYGGTARWLAATHGAHVTALTLSPAQLAYAQEQRVPAGAPSPTYRLENWLETTLASSTFDAVVMLESTEHIPDLARCLKEAHRVLRPGGRVAICAWLARETPAAWEVRWLLEPICREGRLAGLGTLSEYVQALGDAGFNLERAEDVSQNVRRTWSVIIRRVLAGVVTRSDYRRYLYNPKHRERVFALTLFRLWLAYRVGALRYGMLSAIKEP